MNEPTVKQVIEAKRELERQIAAMLNAFEDRCFVIVRKVRVNDATGTSGVKLIVDIT